MAHALVYFSETSTYILGGFYGFIYFMINIYLNIYVVILDEIVVSFHLK